MWIWAIAAGVAALLYWLPLIRRAVSDTVGIARHGAGFIHSRRLKCGDALTLHLAGKSITFLFHPSAIHTFFTAPEHLIAFRPAIEHFTQRVFTLPSGRFFPKHEAMLGALRHLLAPAALHAHLQSLEASMRAQLLRFWPANGDVDLLQAMKDLLFRPTVEAIFGSAFLQRHGAARLQAAFFAFEAGFELAASPLPHLCQLGFCGARGMLLSAFRASWEAGDFEGSVVGAQMERAGMEPDLAPAASLAVLWAALANTVPATFWSTAFLLLPANAEHRAAVFDELARALGTAGGLSQAALDRKSRLAACVAEAVRLRAPGIDLRMAVADLELPVLAAGGAAAPLRLRKGQLLAVSPWESHRDDRLFGRDAAAYGPCRSGAVGLGGVPGAGGIAGFAFGGGRYRCPGRHFAEAEVGLAVALLLTSFNLTLRGCAGSITTAAASTCRRKGVRLRCPECGRAAAGCAEGLLPQSELRRQVGVRWPKEACWVTVQRRL